MAVNAYLTFTDSSGGSKAKIKVLDVSFGFTQNTDSTGKPTGQPLINQINVTVETTKDTQIVEWMILPDALKNGIIEITLKNNVRKSIAFENAHCVQYQESFNAHGGDSPMHINFTISPESITIDDSIWLSNIPEVIRS